MSRGEFQLRMGLTLEAEPQPVPDGLAGDLPGVLEVLFRCPSCPKTQTNSRPAAPAG